MKTKRIAGAVLVAALIVIIRCTADKVAGNSTPTGNPTVAGVLYDADGAKAAHATVRFYPVNYDPQTGSLGKTKTVAAITGIDSTTTDGSGNYSATLDSGSYNLLASGDTTLAYHDSLTTIKGGTLHPADTLRSPGALRGVIQMQGSDDPRTVFIIFIGTGNVYVPQDSLGNFLIPKLAQGSYHVRFLTTLDNYKVKDTTLGVTAGKTDTLASPIQLQYTGIPVPAGLHIQYDTNMQVVTLLWNQPTTGTKVAYYDIFRKQSDSVVFVQIQSGVGDTSYQDTTGIQDNTYTYKVAAVDTNGTIGIMSGGVTILLCTRFKIDTLFGGTGNGPGQFNNMAGITGDQFENIYVANYSPGRIQVFDQNLTYQFEIDSPKVSSPGGVAVDSLKNIYTKGNNSRIEKFNSSGDSIGSFPTGSNLITDICIHGNNLYLRYDYGVPGTGTWYDSVIVMDLNGNRIRSWPTDLGGQGAINSDSSAKIFLTGEEGDIWIFDTLGNLNNKIATDNYMGINGKVFFDSKGRAIIMQSYWILGGQSYSGFLVLNNQGQAIAKYTIPQQSMGSGGSMYASFIGGKKLIYINLYQINKIIKLDNLLP